MRSEQDFFADFPELLDAEVNWGKEVLAHFGLLFSSYALLEASLQNCITFWRKLMFVQTIDRKNTHEELIAQWEQEHDKVEQLAIASTFGSLLKLLTDCPFLDGCRDELLSLKAKRDYFAHHFFRETASFHVSDALRLRMLRSMDALRLRVKEAEDFADSAVTAMHAKLYPTKDLNALALAEFEEERAQILRERQDHEVRFGWEDEDAQQ